MYKMNTQPDAKAAALREANLQKRIAAAPPDQRKRIEEKARSREEAMSQLTPEEQEAVRKFMKILNTLKKP
jgi:negative regulator of replication initiation